jgi:23S rRNA G2445 N2-methylase RlmL
MNFTQTIVLTGISELISILENDAKELTKKKVSSQGRLVFVEDCTPKDASILAYRCQATYHVGMVLCKIKLKGNESPKDHEQKILEELKTFNKDKKEEVQEYFKNISSFKVQTVKLRECEYSSTDYNVDVGSACKELCDLVGANMSVDLKQPDMQFLYLIDKDQAVLCIDYIGEELQKRPYKIFSQSSSLNSVFAYSILRLSGVKKKDLFVDCFCGGGTLPIEFAYFATETSSFVFEKRFMGLRYDFCSKEFIGMQEALSKKIQEKNVVEDKKIYGFDKQFNTILQAQKNSKLSGLFNKMTFSKVSIDWVDSKFDQGEVDVLVSNLPKISKRMNNGKEVKKVVEELFYQAKFMIKSKGTLNILFNDEELLKTINEKYNFKELMVKRIKQGEQEYLFVSYEL